MPLAAIGAELEATSVLVDRSSENLVHQDSLDKFETFEPQSLGSSNLISQLGELQDEAQVNISSDQAYILGAGDTIYMEIFMLADYSREYAVAADGTLTFPLVGTVKAQGMTLAALTDEMALKKG
jgi:hypothetical protein